MMMNLNSKAIEQYLASSLPIHDIVSISVSLEQNTDSRRSLRILIQCHWASDINSDF